MLSNDSESDLLTQTWTRISIEWLVTSVLYSDRPITVQEGWQEVHMIREIGLCGKLAVVYYAVLNWMVEWSLPAPTRPGWLCTQTQARQIRCHSDFNSDSILWDWNKTQCMTTLGSMGWKQALCAPGLVCSILGQSGPALNFVNLMTFFYLHGWINLEKCPACVGASN